MSTLYYPRGNTRLKEIFSPEDAQRCAVDPVYFINKYCWTFDPRPTAPEHHLRFHLYPFQEPFVRWVVECIRTGNDAFVEKTRDMGASWLVLDAILWLWLYEPGFSALVGSRKEDYVDNRTADSLFGKFDYTLDRLPFKPKGFNTKEHRTYMKLVNPENGNTIKGESANDEFSRAGRYSVVFFDEFAFWPRPETAWTAAGEATQCRFAVTTPPRVPNFVSVLRKLIADKQLNIQFQSLHWRLHPLKTEAWYAEQKKRKLPEELAQEIDINWEGSLTGRTYPEVAHVRLGEFPYRPDWPLYVSHDPGHDPDPYALTWWQADPQTGRVRLVEAFEKRQAIVDWFAPLFGHPMSSEFSYNQDEYDFIGVVGQWRGATHFGDPAIRQGNVVSGDSARDHWRKTYDIYVQSNTKANDLMSRKLATKRLLQNLDVNDTPRTRYWLECMKNAHYPELGENSQRVTENVKPVHDWTSHLRTSTEYFAVCFDWDIKEEIPTGLTFARAGAMIDRKNSSSKYIGNE